MVDMSTELAKYLPISFFQSYLGCKVLKIS